MNERHTGRVPCAKKRLLERHSQRKAGLLWPEARWAAGGGAGRRLWFVWFPCSLFRHLPHRRWRTNKWHSSRDKWGLVCILEWSLYGWLGRLSWKATRPELAWSPFGKRPVGDLRTPVLGPNGNGIKEEIDSRKIWEEKWSGFGDWIGNVGKGRRKLSGLDILGWLESPGI